MNQPSKFLKFNGTQLLKPLNWHDFEIIHIIQEVIGSRLTNLEAIEKIYKLTGERPSRRIFQQRVRRHREDRIKKISGSLSSSLTSTPTLSSSATFASLTISSGTSSLASSSATSSATVSPEENSIDSSTFKKVNFSINEINHLIKSIDYNWLQQFIDEENYDELLSASSDDVDEEISSSTAETTTTKLLNPAHLRTLIINIENILNFMQQSIKVYSSVNAESFKEWEMFGKLLADLIKLKEIYEPHIGNPSRNLINNGIKFADSVKDWIKNDVLKDSSSTKIPKTNLTEFEFQKLIDFLKNFNITLFDYTGAFESSLQYGVPDIKQKAMKLSSALANSICLIGEIVHRVTVAENENNETEVEESSIASNGNLVFFDL